MNGEQFYHFAEQLSGLLKDNQIMMTLIIIGISFLMAGIGINSYNQKAILVKRPGNSGKGAVSHNISLIVEKVTQLFPLNVLKKNIKSNLYIIENNEVRLNLYSGIIALALTIEVIINTLLLIKIGQLWYVKLLVLLMSILLPYYVLTLLLELYRHYVSRNIPQMIDEFRSAFIKHRKVKPALLECSKYIDRRLGLAIKGAADAPYMEDILIRIRDSFNNSWFNIFVALIINFKNNGGEFIDQLYRLNKTITRYNNLEKKKNKRLIWYELFAVTASVISIPAVLWINSVILGNEAGILIDAQSNMIITRIIGFSILSLIVVRVLRKI